MTTIERAGLSDVDAVVEAWVALADDQRAHGSHLLPAENRDAVREIVGSHALSGGLVVARDGDDLVGFVLFSVERDAFERDATRGVVRDVWVRPADRDRGIGSRLMDAAERRLADQGADVVALEVMADNEAARRLYRRRGYRPHRVTMEKPLE